MHVDMLRRSCVQKVEATRGACKWIILLRPCVIMLTRTGEHCCGLHKQLVCLRTSSLTGLVRVPTVPACN
jgi:hypothetical protein